MSSEYVIHVRPFSIGTDKDVALKPLEEAAEAFGEWQTADRDSDGIEDIVYECCDVIQAACNLMLRVGATQEDVNVAMYAVEEANKARGRYGSDEAGTSC